MALLADIRMRTRRKPVADPAGGRLNRPSSWRGRLVEAEPSWGFLAAHGDNSDTNEITGGGRVFCRRELLNSREKPVLMCRRRKVLSD